MLAAFEGAAFREDNHLSAGGQELHPSDVYNSITGVRVAPEAAEQLPAEFDMEKASKVPVSRTKLAIKNVVSFMVIGLLVPHQSDSAPGLLHPGLLYAELTALGLAQCEAEQRAHLAQIIHVFRGPHQDIGGVFAAKQAKRFARNLDTHIQ